MIKYKLVKAESSTALQEKVTVLLNEGWRCQGGVATIYYMVREVECTSFTQAMILDEDQLRQWKEMII